MCETKFAYAFHIGILRSFWALAIIIGSASAASGNVYGEVEVSLVSEPPTPSTHGYAEVWIRITNRSTTTAHEVRLTLPKHTYYSGSDILRAVSRTVTIEPGKTVRVSLSYPEQHSLEGEGVSVVIDGRKQEDALPVRMATYSSHRYGHSPSDKLILRSRSVDTRFMDWMEIALARNPTKASSRTSSTRVAVPEQPVAEWSPNWLGYTRYDGVVIAANDYRGMPTEVRGAIEQYVECGGSLLIIGTGVNLPKGWKQEHDKDGLKRYSAGFGECFVSATDPSEWDDGPAVALHDSWTRSRTPWYGQRDPIDANRQFPVVENLQVPVQGLLLLMVLFAVIIGPVNMVLLNRYKRRLWLFLTVPLISLVTCVSIFGYMLVSEGWSGKSRIEGITFLDENTHRASSLGWEAFYTPVQPRDGLRFSTGTEVSYQNGNDRYSHGRRDSNTSRTIDWNGEQILAAGWLTPRVPSHFVVRKGEYRRERMTITTPAGGQPEVVNGLGADVSQFWYVDASGKMYQARNVQAGGRATLEPASIPHSGAKESLRIIYASDWSTIVNRMENEGVHYLQPRSYMAILDAAPFLDEGLAGVSNSRQRSVVIGLLKEGGDEN